MTQPQTGAAAATQPADAGANAQDMAFDQFTLNDVAKKDLQRYRNEASRTAFGDNALAVLLVGGAKWTPQQVQDLTGIQSAHTARACRAWNENGISGIRSMGPASYMN
jgi:hypothetical protein